MYRKQKLQNVQQMNKMFFSGSADICTPCFSSYILRIINLGQPMLKLNNKSVIIHANREIIIIKEVIGL